jgi:hypothetical protein
MHEISAYHMSLLGSAAIIHTEISLDTESTSYKLWSHKQNNSISKILIISNRCHKHVDSYVDAAIIGF